MMTAMGENNLFYSYWVSRNKHMVITRFQFADYPLIMGGKVELMLEICRSSFFSLFEKGVWKLEG